MTVLEFIIAFLCGVIASTVARIVFPCDGDAGGADDR